MVFTLNSSLLKCGVDSPAVRNKLVYYCINRPHSHFRAREESAEKLPLTTLIALQSVFIIQLLWNQRKGLMRWHVTLSVSVSPAQRHTLTQTDESQGTDISPPQIALCPSFSLYFFIAAMYSPTFWLNRWTRGTERGGGCHSNMPTCQ